MKPNYIPAVILAAGKGKRLENWKKHKSLLEFSGKKKIIDFIFQNLSHHKTNNIIVIHNGHPDGLSEYVCKLRKKRIHTEFNEDLHVKLIQAREDFTKGPLFTLCTLNNIIADQNQFLYSQDLVELVQNSVFFSIMPSDTVIHPEIYDWIFQMLKLNEDNKICYIFEISIAKTMLNDMKKAFKFDARNNPFSKQIKDESSVNLIVPFVVISQEFLTIARNAIFKGARTLFDVLQKMEKKSDHVKVYRKEFKRKYPPFLDIDTAEKHEILLKNRNFYAINEKST